MEPWTTEEEKIIAQIMASETMHDPENHKGDIRIQCNRMEALRRLQRRKVNGVYRAPSKPWVIADVNLPVTPRQTVAPERVALMLAGRQAKRDQKAA